jgi:Zn-dependent peptidase ImmA (M78 family)
MHLTILGRKIRVKVILQRNLIKLAEDPNTVAMYDPNNQCIYISKELSEKQKRYYLIHEAVHCLHDLTGIDQTLHESLIEVICQSTATLFEDLCRK